MKTHSFTTDDARKVDNEALKEVAKFAPIDRSDYSHNDNDIYIEIAGSGPKSLKDIIKQEKPKGYEPTSHDMVVGLQEKYALTKDQAEYIVRANNTGMMGGATGSFAEVESKLLTTKAVGPVNIPIRRNIPMSKVTIDDSGNITYSGGNKILFDCPEGMDGSLAGKFPKLSDSFISHDYVTINMSVNLGTAKDNNPDIYSTPITINVAGTGNMGEKFVTELGNIKSNIPQKKPEDIVADYTEFSESLYNVNNINTKQKENIVATVLSPIFNQKKLTEEQQEQLDKEVALLQKLDSVPQILAEALVDKIYSSLEKQEDKKSIIDKAAANLKQFFPNKKDGYLKLAAEDVVNAIDKARPKGDYQEEKKGIIQRFGEMITKWWYEYKTTDLTQNKNLIEAAHKVVASAKDNIKALPPSNNIQPGNTPHIPRKNKVIRK